MPSLVDRRQLLQLGTLGYFGLRLADLLAGETLASDAAAGRATAGRRVRNCIFVFMEGGPSHIDLWDMKPQAPAEVRGAFRPIASTVPGVQVCEHLPHLARQMHRVALVRSLHHKVVDHNAGAYYALTGRSPFVGGRLIIHDEAENFPPFGAVLARSARAENSSARGSGGLADRGKSLAATPFVHIPEIASNNGFDLPGQRAGFLGSAFDPLVTGDPSQPGFDVPSLSLSSDVSASRLAARRKLLEGVERRAAELAADSAVAALDANRRRAFELVSGTAARRAFEIGREPQRVRERYGLPDRTDRSREARQFGGLPHLGQSLLLARRLVEAGVRLVTVCTGRRYDQAWDTHRDHFALLEKSLLPYFDRGLAALLEDLAERGMLEDTLVVALGEFGRTPRLGQLTSPAGADHSGRDHWPHCYTALLAGAGIHGGAVVGASDKLAAYPALRPVTPEDIAATIYRALGIDPAGAIRDRLGRDHRLALGTPIHELFT